MATKQTIANLVGTEAATNLERLAEAARLRPVVQVQSEQTVPEVIVVRLTTLPVRGVTLESRVKRLLKSILRRHGFRAEILSGLTEESTS